MLLKALLSLFKSLQFVTAYSFPFQCTMDVAFNGKRCAFELVGDFVGRIAPLWHCFSLFGGKEIEKLLRIVKMLTKLIKIPFLYLSWN